MKYMYIKVINTKNKSFAYNSVINRIALMPETLNNDFIFTSDYLIKKKDIYKNLLEQNFFKEYNRCKISNRLNPFVKDIIKNRLKRLTLQVTYNCNLKCKYCFFSDAYTHSKNRNIMMNEKIAKKSIDYYLAHSKKCNRYEFSFYGGEPLLNFSLIKYCVDYILQKIDGRKIDFYITTNFTILNDEILEFLVNNNFNIAISLDGPEEIHNEFRKFSNNQGSYSVLVENLKYTKKKYRKFYDTITFNAVLSNEYNFNKVKKYFINNELFKMKNGNCLNFVISPLYCGMKENFLNQEKVLLKGSIRNYVEEYKNNDTIFKEYIISFLKYNCIISKDVELWGYEYLINWLTEFKTIQAQKNITVFEEDHPSGACIAGSTRLMVDPEGNFWPCEKINTNNLALSIGSINTGICYDRVIEMLNIFNDRESCKKCWAFKYCGQCISVVTNLKKEIACKESCSLLEKELYYYCTLELINNKYLKEKVKTEYSETEIYKFLSNSCKINLETIDSLMEPDEKALIIYEIIIILKNIFCIEVELEDILKYNKFNSFFRNTIIKNKDRISTNLSLIE